MNRQQQQEHAIRLVARYLDDNLPLDKVLEDQELISRQDDEALREVHDLCGQILRQLQVQVRNAHPEKFWWEEYSDADE